MMAEAPKNVVNPAPAEGKAMLPVFEVLVERSNQETISTEVFEFEIPVLKKLHGEERVTVGENTYDAECDNDANAVLRTLRSKYNQKGGRDVVEPVYRDADELASKSGLAKSKSLKARVESEQTDNRKKSK